MIENLLIMESLAKNENKMLCKADCTINGIANQKPMLKLKPINHTSYKNTALKETPSFCNCLKRIFIPQKDYI